MLSIIKLLVVSASLIVSNWALADVSKKSAAYFSQLYAKTCVRDAADMSLLKVRFDEAQVPELSKKKAAIFLQKKPGTVWVIPNLIGDYLVSIDNSDSCSVYTRGVNINAVEAAFNSLFDELAKTLKVEKVQDETLQTKLGPKHYIRYSIINQKDNSTQHFSLETSTAERIEIQAKATVSVVIDKSSQDSISTD